MSVFLNKEIRIALNYKHTCQNLLFFFIHMPKLLEEGENIVAKQFSL